MLTWNVGLLFFKNELIFFKFCFNSNMLTVDSYVPQTKYLWSPGFVRSVLLRFWDQNVLRTRRLCLTAATKIQWLKQDRKYFFVCVIAWGEWFLLFCGSVWWFRNSGSFTLVFLLIPRTVAMTLYCVIGLVKTRFLVPVSRISDSWVWGIGLGNCFISLARD